MSFTGNLDKMSIADLKAAYDFVREDMKDLEEKAASKNKRPEEIPAYPEVSTVQTALYHVLLNKTRDLFTELPKPDMKP